MLPRWIFWVVFNGFVLAILALDLGVFRRDKRAPSFREAIGWTVLWVALAAGFALLVYAFGNDMVGGTSRSNPQLTLEFLTGYVIEQSLSVDNLFLFLLIFRYFDVPDALQHTVLFWGVVGALLMRGVFIFAGVALLNRFHWVSYLFGAILVYSGIRLFRQHGTKVPPEPNLVLQGFRKLFRVSDAYEGDRFFVRRGALTYATPLMLVLVVVETTDVIFAVDSIPAVLAVTREPFVAYTSNAFAILGLRSLFFVLAGMMERFHLLHYGLALILVLIGVKMLASNFVEIRTEIALLLIAVILLGSVCWSLMVPKTASG
jgi:tellurite resistance protein TerC